MSVQREESRGMGLTPQEMRDRSSALMAQRAQNFIGDMAAVLKTIPATYRVLFSKAASGEASPRQAIKAKCQECVGFEDVGNRVGGCTCYKCPLFKYRPYQDRNETEGEE